MENLLGMYTIKRQTKLHEPVHNLYLFKLLLLLLALLDMICQVTMLAKFHYNDEDPFIDLACLVGYNVGMVQLLEQFGLFGD